MTVTELSKITGFSISTVSKALSDSGEISPATKEEILRVARETGYYDKAIKRKKRIGQPKTVGIITSDFSDARILRNLCRELEKRDVAAVVSMAADADVLLSQYLGVDCVLFMEGRVKSCSVPAFAFDGDVYSTADKISDGEAETIEETSDENFSASRKKEDIWLF